MKFEVLPQDIVKANEERQISNFIGLGNFCPITQALKRTLHDIGIDVVHAETTFEGIDLEFEDKSRLWLRFNLKPFATKEMKDFMTRWDANPEYVGKCSVFIPDSKVEDLRSRVRTL